jgi:1-deoxy-D-xylulose-5-phosphate reductoisomerase
VELARVAGQAAGCAPAVFNAANEELVAAFHGGRCGFLPIVDVAGRVLRRWLDTQHSAAGSPRDVDDVEQAQDWARREVATVLGAR